MLRHALRPYLLSLCLFAPAAMAIELPTLGDTSSSIVSLEQEYRLGRAWLSILRGQVEQLKDPLLKDYVERTVYKLAETSQLQERRLEFILLASPQLNAFAAPGGIIGVNGGLFIHARTEAEYASVMAHELAHLSQRHFARGLEAQQRMQLPMFGALLAGVVAAAAGATDVGMATIMSGQAAAFQEQRRFSRENEQEADRIGMVNLARAGFDPRAMPSMFERLARQYRFEGSMPEFLLTHPVTESRIADTRNRAEQLIAKATNPGALDSLSYQLLRARVVLNFNSSPAQALKNFEADLEKNPKNTAASYGKALALSRLGRHRQARQQLQPLLKQAPGSQIFLTSMIELEIATQDYTAALTLADQALELLPSSFPLQMARIEALLGLQQYQQAEQALTQLVKQRNQDPDIWYELAEVRGKTGNIIGVHEARAEFFARVGSYRQAIEQLGYARRLVKNNFPLSARLEARQEELVKEEQQAKQMFR